MTSKAVYVAIAALSAAIACGFAVQAEEKKADAKKAEGKPVDLTVTASIVQQESKALASPDRSVAVQLGTGTAKLPGDPIDGAEALLSETVVLDKGAGVDHGIVSFSTPQGSITQAYWGTAKTVMVDGQPRTTTSGLYRMTVGTGIYAGGSGSGTYAGTFTSKTAFVSEFKGVLKMPAAK